MSFAPPTPTGPAGPHGPGRPRSTPIPGFESPLPGNTGSVPPPRPTEFVNAAPSSPMGFGLPTDAPPPVTGSPGRSWGAIALVIILFAGPIVGLGVGVWAFLRSRETADQADQAIEDAQQTVDSLLQQAQDEIDAISVPQVTVPDMTLPAAAAPVPRSAVRPLRLRCSPTAARPRSSPRSTLRSAASRAGSCRCSSIPTTRSSVPRTPTSPITSTSTRGATAWSVPRARSRWWAPAISRRTCGTPTEVDWTFLARAVAEAPGLTTVEEGAVSHIIVDRSVFTPDFAITVKVYVTGPRGGGYVEYTPTGELIQVVQ